MARMGSVILQRVKLSLRPTTETDLDFVVDVEADPEAAQFIGAALRDDHRDAIAAADTEHLLVVADARPAGFALLADLDNADRSIEIRRIVVSPRGQGLGRQALALIVDHAFTRHGANRVWLDTFTWNERAQRAYTAAGFVREAVLRDAMRKGGRHESLVVMSRLRAEWEGGPEP